MAELFDVTVRTDDQPLSNDALAAAMQSCDVLVPTVTDDIDAALIARAGPDLRLIANYGNGVDHIALKSARDAGIIITNTPGVFTEDTADMTMALILSVSRRLAEGVRLVHSHNWRGWSPTHMLGHRVGGRILGIVGMGRIGQAVARRAKAFNLSIHYHSRHRLPAAIEDGLGAVWHESIDTLLPVADILSVHMPHTPETHGMIGADRIAAMKPGATFINTARGEICDEAALITALENGHIAGAGLDVFSEEPAIDERLLALPNVVLMPHMGSATHEGRDESGLRVIANIRAWVDGHRPPDQVLAEWV